ncbi:MAG TPA: isochorismatase family cysteine hydrolase [Polyangiaceae bacterium]|jgi:nicotinamidase-related amidase
MPKRIHTKGVRSARTPALGDEQCGAALVLLDVINAFDFPGAEALLRVAAPAVTAIRRLKERCAAHHVPTIYVNDNFGRWRSDFRSLVRHCARPQARGRRLVASLRPDSRDYFVLKPQNSGFFSTVLETLLRHLGVHTLILCGFSTDNCVLFTAHDAYLRKLKLFVPSDCCAAETPLAQRRALELMARSAKADTRPSSRIPLDGLME